VRSEGAVDPAFDAAHREVPVACPVDLVAREPFGEALVVLGEHDPQAERQLAGRSHTLEQLDLAKARTGILERGDAVGQHLGASQLDHATHGRLVPLAIKLRCDEVFGGFAQHTNRPSPGITHDFATRRVRRPAVDTRHLQGQSVDHRGVSARVGEHHRVVGRHRRQGVMVRQTQDIGFGDRVPLLLVPAAAQDPLSGFGFGNRRLDHRHDFVEISHRPEVELHLRAADAQEMTVTLDQAGDCECATEIDDLGVGSDES